MRKAITISVALALCAACASINEVELTPSRPWKVTYDGNELRAELFAIGSPMIAIGSQTYEFKGIDEIYKLNPNNFKRTNMLTVPGRQSDRWNYIKSPESGIVYKYHLSEGETIRLPVWAVNPQK